MNRLLVFTYCPVRTERFHYPLRQEVSKITIHFRRTGHHTNKCYVLIDTMDSTHLYVKSRFKIVLIRIRRRFQQNLVDYSKI